MKQRVKQIITKLFVAMLITGLVFPHSAQVVDAADYNPSTALSYAEKHWNDGKGLCAEFVSDCLKAGGIPASTAYSASCTALRRQLRASGLGTEYTVTLSNGYVTKSACPNLSAGDVVFYYCPNHEGISGNAWSTHVVLSNGFDTNGRMKVYSHNRAQNGNSAVPYTRCGEDDCGRTFQTAYVYHFGGSNNQTPTPTPNSITFSKTSVSLKKGESTQVPFTFKGDGIYRLEVRNTNSDVVSVSIGDINYTTGNAVLYLTGGPTSGSATVFVHFMNSAGQSFFNKSIAVTRTPEANSLALSRDSITVNTGGTAQVTANFTGENLKTIYSDTGNTKLFTTSISNISYGNGKGSATINLTAGAVAGETNLKVRIVDTNDKEVLSKTIPVKVQGTYSVKFDKSFADLLYVGEDYEVGFTIDGIKAVTNVKTDIDKTDVVEPVGWKGSGVDFSTGKGTMIVRPKKTGNGWIVVRLLDVNNKEVYVGSRPLTVIERPEIYVKESSFYNAEGGTPYSTGITWKGDFVSKIVVSSDDPSIAEASLTYNSAEDNKGTLTINFKKEGRTSINITALRSSGQEMAKKTIPVIVGSSSHSITVNTPTGGTVSANRTSAKRGETVSITVNPFAGYELDTLTVTPAGGTAQNIKSSQRFTMGNSNVTVNATFKKKTYTITTLTPEGGTLRVSQQSAGLGDYISVFASPNSGYALEKISVSSAVSSGETTVSGTVFIMPAANVTVKADFRKTAPDTYYISTSFNEGGSLSLSTWSGAEGTPITVNYTAYPGYTLESLAYETTVNGVKTDITASRTFNMPASPVIIHAVFRKVMANEDIEGGESTDEDSAPVIPDVEEDPVEVTEPDESAEPVVIDDVEVPDTYVEPIDNSFVDSTTGFVDVARPSWYAAAVDWAKERGYVAGVSASLFGVGQPIKREDAAIILTKYLNGTPQEATSIPFRDVSVGRYYSNYVLWANNNDLMNGYPDGTFGTGRTITRAEVATVLKKAVDPYGVGYKDFPDATAAWMLSYTRWAGTKGVVSGYPDGTFRPDNPCTREEFVQMLKNADALRN